MAGPREGSEIRARPGSIEVELPESPTTGYRWVVGEVPAGVEVEGHDFRPQTGEMVAGGAGTRAFRLAVSSPGTYELEFRLGRAWEAEPLRRRIVTLVITAPE